MSCFCYVVFFWIPRIFIDLFNTGGRSMKLLRTPDHRFVNLTGYPFEPNYVLLRQKGRDFFKTGTLHGINARAGYIASKNGGRYRYVVMINTPGKTTRPIMNQLRKILP